MSGLGSKQERAVERIARLFLLGEYERARQKPTGELDHPYASRNASLACLPQGLNGAAAVGLSRRTDGRPFPDRIG
jgi:hypothetical protein